MKQFARQHWTNVISVLVAFPALYFVFVCILKFGLGIYSPYESIAPILEKNGISGSPWLKINMLILAGPIIAFILSVFKVLRIRTQFTRHHFLLNLMLKKRWFALLIAAFSITILSILFLYLVGDNSIQSL